MIGCETRIYKNTEEQLKEKQSNLNLLIKILDSNLKQYEKIIEMARIYSTPEKFRRSYQLIYNYGQNDPLFKGSINRFINIYNFYLACEENGLLANARYILSIEGYIEEYEMAEKVINEYINSDKSYKVYNFFMNMGINIDQFKRYVKTIENINPILFQECTKKFEENKKIRFYTNYQTVKDIARAIDTGVFNDGNQLTVLEFLRRIPFINNSDFSNKLIEFIKRNCSKEEFNIIIKYMNDNKLFDKNLSKMLNIKRLYEEKTIVNGYEITKEDNDKILEYMRKNDYPFIRKVYILIRREYLNGNINLEKELEIVKTKDKKTS